MANTNTRAYAAAHFALELDGKSDIGLFRSIEGGSLKADVMTYQSGQSYERWRQLGKPKYEDFKLQVGMSMSKPFYDWIAAFFKGEAIRKTGAIVAADFYYVERARREFKEAMIKELSFPKLDGADKNAAYMTIGVAVEEMTFKPGAGKKLTQTTGMEGQKLWTACNFRFSLDGFEDACKNVSKVDSFTVKQTIIEYHQGNLRAPIKVPSQIDFPNLSFYVPEADATKFQEHITKRVSAGEQPGRLSGMIQTFDNEKKPLFTLSFYNADILAVTPDKADSSSEEIKQCKIDIYTEKMEFEYVAMQPV
ncbi:MAG TPA: phage tail protein [Kofleriaceae bacterium]